VNSRERVLAAINHEEIDYFPLDLGGPISGVSKIAYDAYLLKYAPEYHPSDLCDKFQQLGCLHEEMLKRWKVDTRHAGAGFKTKDIDENTYFDAFGVKHRSVYSSHYNTVIYFDQVDWPLKNTRKIENVERIEWPSLEELDISGLRSSAKKILDQECAVILDAPTGGILELMTWMVGLETFFGDLHAHYEFFVALIDEITDTFYLPYWKKVIPEVTDRIDIVLIGDDYGMQDRMIISPRMWRKLVKPRVKKVVKVIKELADVKVMLHCCGSIYPIIPDLIEIGFDILNNLQPRAQDMDHKKIKSKFGDKLCFHGGVDIQHILPKGTQKEVQKEVQRVFNTLGVDGTGYILATAHNILADVPPQNINAYLENRTRET
jgi:uroporphyrinogen decarboxylase